MAEEIEKQEAAQEGAPIWIISYADMVTLLMAFFIAMLSMSTLKEDKFEKTIQSFAKALGYQGGGWLAHGIPGGGVTFEEQVKQLNQALSVKRLKLQKGYSKEKGIGGDNPSVKTIREGLQFTIGGRVSFELGKAELLSQAQEELSVLADVIRGMNNKVRISGHTSRIPSDQYHPFKSLDDLSFARAVAVKECLIAHGIRPQRMAVEACGANEPIRTQAYDAAQRALNDRVSIIVMEALVEDFEGAPVSNAGDIVDG